MKRSAFDPAGNGDGRRIGPTHVQRSDLPLKWQPSPSDIQSLKRNPGSESWHLNTFDKGSEARTVS